MNDGRLPWLGQADDFWLWELEMEDCEGGFMSDGTGGARS